MSISKKLGSNCYLIVAFVALVALQPSTALNAKKANEVCNLLMDGIKIFSGSSCGEYYSCKQGLASLIACEAGYFFSRDTQSCQLESTVTCTVGASPCANVANGMFLAVPDSCTNFYYCYNGVAQLGTCPDGLNFDAAGQSCNYTTDYLCNSGDSTGDSTEDSTDNINFCSVVPNGYYFGSSSACNSWQECRSNGLVTGICPSPYFFNVETASCDYQDNVSCRQTNGVPIVISASGSLAGTSCSNNGVAVSDNQTCIGFYTCTNNAYVYGTCVGGLYFNPPTGECVSRVDAINNCNRCEDTSLQFVNLYQDNCVGYASCSNGRIASEGKCSTGYFNENLAACVEGGTEPLFPVCNVALAANSSTTAAAGNSTTTVSSDSTTGTTTVSGSSTNTTATVAGGSTTTVAGGSTTTVAGGSTTTVAGGSTTTVAGGSTTTVAGGSTTTVAGGSTTTVAGGSTTTVAGGSTTTAATTSTTLA